MVSQLLSEFPDSNNLPRKRRSIKLELDSSSGNSRSQGRDSRINNSNTSGRVRILSEDKLVKTSSEISSTTLLFSLGKVLRTVGSNNKVLHLYSEIPLVAPLSLGKMTFSISSLGPLALRECSMTIPLESSLAMLTSTLITLLLTSLKISDHLATLRMTFFSE